jgi:branched-chain amino acid transport system permease protein
LTVAELDFIVRLAVSGLSIGSIYALVGLGYVLIFKSTGVLNLAQGEIMLVGAYFTFTFVSRGLSFGLALALALACAVLLGLGIERVFLRPMIGEPIFSIVMLTIGLSVFLRGAIGLVWGQDEQVLRVPLFGAIIEIGGLSLSLGHLVVIVTTLVLIVAFSLFYRFTLYGTAMRATASDQDTAMVMGVNVAQVVAVSWGVASLIAVIGGVSLVGLSILKPELSLFAIKALPAVVLGGLDSVVGAILGGLILGLAENFSGGYLGGTAKEAAGYVLLLVVLMMKPYGLFGTREIERV